MIESAPLRITLNLAAVALAGFLSLGAAPRANADEILIADQATNRVIALDATTGDFIRTVTSTGLDLPSSLSFGPGGSLYAANFGAYAGPGSAASVVRINPATGATTPFIDTIAGPGAVAYDPIGTPNNLFVSKLADFEPTVDFSGNEVYQYDAAGGLLRTIGTGSPATGRTGMAFDVDGHLYVAAFGFFSTGSVLEYDSDNNYASLGTYATGAGMAIQGPPGAFIPSQAGGFNSLAFDASGALYVAALTGTSVVKFTPQGASVVGTQIDGPIAYPSGLLFDGGDLLITSLGNNNPSDPYYPGQTFPGTVLRYHPDTGAITPFLVGDANRDNAVNGADLAVLKASLGTSAGGDLDGDLDTDGNDILLWQRNVGNQSASGSFLPTGIVRYATGVGASIVPEPATAGLAAAAAWGLSLVKVRRRRFFK